MEGGDPTNTGDGNISIDMLGGESIYGAPFEDELNPRLKFWCRGILGMASLENDLNKSQFFVTFGPCEQLNRQHTIFGKIVGDTIYNLLNMENLEVDESNKPIHPPFISSINIIQNPFDDIYPRSLKDVRPDLWAHQQRLEADSKKVVKIGTKKKINIVSFGDEEDEDEIVVKKKNKSLSPFDLIKNDKSLSNAAPLSIEEQRILLEREKKVIETSRLKDNILQGKTGDLNDEFIGKRKQLSQRVRNDKSEMEGVTLQRNKKTGKVELQFETSSPDSSSTSSSDDEDLQDEVRKKQIDEYEKMKIDFLKFKKDEMAEDAIQQPTSTEVQPKQKISLLDLKRYKYTKAAKEEVKLKEEDILKKMQAFSKKIRSNKKAPSHHWMKTKLKFHIDSASAYSLQENKAKATQEYKQTPKEIIERVLGKEAIEHIIN